MYVHIGSCWFYSNTDAIFQTNKSDILKTEEELKIIRDYIVDINVKHTIAVRSMKSVQYLLRYMYFIFNNFSYFYIFSMFFSFPNSFKMLYFKDSILMSIISLSIFTFL